MLSRRVAWALSQLASREDGDLPAARRETYAALDPLFRGMIRGRAERAVAAAMFETTRTDDERHVHRLAALRVMGEAAGAPDDVEAVASAFEASRPKTAPSRRGPTLAAAGALGAALVLGGGAAWWLTRPPASLHHEAARTETAWTEGGRPLAGTLEQRAVFEDAVPDFAVDIDAYRRARGTADEARERADVVRAAEAGAAMSEDALGADVTSFLRALFDQSLAVVEGADAEDSFVRAVDALNAAIADAGLEYYVDTEVRIDPQGRRRVYLSTFTVERVRFFDAGPHRLRALRLKRLDRLNFARAVLGFTRPQVRDGLVLLGRIERHLVDAILPGLGPEARMPIVDADTRADARALWVDRVEEIAARDAQAEAVALAGEGALELGRLFARRREILDGWRDRFQGMGLTVTRPTTVDFDLDGYRSLEDRVPVAEWRELGAVASDLRSDVPRGAYRELEERLIESVERHEVQHRLDYASGTLETTPAPLVELLGPEHPVAARATAELSAYTSELARGPDVVKMNLALLARHVLARHNQGSPEHYAGLVILDGLAEQLGIARRPFVEHRRVDRQAVAFAYLEIRDRSAAELSAAAAALWEALFGRPLPPLSAR